MNFFRSRSFIVLGMLLSPVFCMPAGAVTTSHWTHTSEADFSSGHLERVVASNLGDLKLSRAIKTLLEQDSRVSAVYAMAQGPDKTIYAGTGPQGVLLAIKDDKVTTAATLGANTNIFSLLIDNQGRLLIGTGGEKGQIFRVEKPGQAPKVIFSADSVQYIWAIRQTPDGLIYAATGPEGQLFQINPDGTHQVVFDSDENNLLCMISDGKDTLYVGTDPNGLVYRINRKTKQVFVLYDAAESEISALAMDAAGNLYAATAEPAGDQPAPSDSSDSEKAGRPEGQSTGVPIPSKPPENPAPPEKPKPNPGEPAPIPKSPNLMSTEANEPGSDPEPGVPGKSIHVQAATTEASKAPPLTSGMKPRPEGNAIYRIDTEGFVTEIFRQPVLVLSLLERDGTLLVGTGSDGVIYQVNPAAEETLALAKVDPKEILCLLPADDGRVWMGMANTGGLAAMSSGFASEGTFTSPVMDAQQISRFGKIHLHGTLPEKTTLKLATRSGNAREAGEIGWSAWSGDAPAAEYMPVGSPSARFFQYRLTFTSGDGKQTPNVEDVDVAYQLPNLAPKIKSIKIADKVDDAAAAAPGNSAKTSKPAHAQTISWEASDLNSDPLEYTLYFRSGKTSPWVLLKDKLKETQYEWETRTVADGRYEVKVVASDSAANPTGQGKSTSRVSDPVLIDNTPPVIGDIKTSAKGRHLQVDLRVIDRGSSVGNCEYAIDSGDWQAVLPSDNIYDEPEETVRFTLDGLTPGAHQIAIRATDARGNQAYETISVSIEKD